MIQSASASVSTAEEAQTSIREGGYVPALTATVLGRLPGHSRGHVADEGDAAAGQAKLDGSVSLFGDEQGQQGRACERANMARQARHQTGEREMGERMQRSAAWYESLWHHQCPEAKSW